MRYYLGIDNGGTAVKAVLFNENGDVVSQAKKIMTIELPHLHWAERDMEKLWKANCDVIRETVATAAVDSKDIRAVSFSGHGKGLYLVDENGNPVRKGILSSDTRAWTWQNEWQRSGTAKEFSRRSLQGVMSCQPLCLLRWLKEEEPESYRKIRWVLGVKDYIRLRMTGVACAEITDFSGSGLVNLRTGRYDSEILVLAGLTEMDGRLPPLKRSFDCAGKVTAACAAETGLEEGTTCAAGLFDIDVCALGMGVLDEENIAVIAGTWGINEYISSEPVIDSGVTMNSLYCLPGWYLIEESSPTSASNFEWFVQQFVRPLWQIDRRDGEDLYSFAVRLAASVSDDESVPEYLPYLYGNPDSALALGCFVGLSASHGVAHLARSVMEGIVFCHKYQVEKLLKNKKTPPKAVRLSGGVCNSPFWTQMFADVLELPVELSACAESGALDSALAAAVACGGQKDIASAVKSMVKVTKTVLPSPATFARYRERYTRYLYVARQSNVFWEPAPKAKQALIRSTLRPESRQQFYKERNALTWLEDSKSIS